MRKQFLKNRMKDRKASPFETLYELFCLTKKVTKKQKSLQDLSGFVSSAPRPKCLRLPEWKFCLGKIYSEPRRIFTICRGFMVCKTVRVNKPSPKEKPKLAVTVRATKASLSRLRENEGGGPREPLIMRNKSVFALFERNF